jgi:hypothetical protein
MTLWVPPRATATNHPNSGLHVTLFHALPALALASVHVSASVLDIACPLDATATNTPNWGLQQTLVQLAISSELGYPTQDTLFELFITLWVLAVATATNIANSGLQQTLLHGMTLLADLGVHTTPSGLVMTGWESPEDATAQNLSNRGLQATLVHTLVSFDGIWGIIRLTSSRL